MLFRSSIHWLHRIRQPTLVLAGDDDPIIPLINMRVLAWRIPNAELHVIDDGHLFLVTRAESVAPIIMKFLAEERRRAVMHPRPFLPKTGYLVGATPWRQQVALIVGCIVGALVIPPVLELLYSAYGFTGALPREGMDPGQALAAPQATLMTAIASGIFHDALNWNMILIGVALGIALILVDLLLRRTGKACLPVLAVGLVVLVAMIALSVILWGSGVGPEYTS